MGHLEYIVGHLEYIVGHLEYIVGHLEYISTLGDIMVTVAMSTLRGKFSMSEGYHEYTGVG